MFYGLENTQPETALQLETLVKAGNFPSSVLFYGPQCSSRMYAALCVAKAMGSETDSTVIVSDRNYRIRITAALNLFRKSRNSASKKFLKHEVTTFLKQYHGALMDSQSSSVRKKFSNAGECSELIESIDSVFETECEKYADKLEKALGGLFEGEGSSFTSKQSVSVSQIRALRQWAGESSVEGLKKFIIIENLENASDSASNALLKILEEPPADTHFILVSENIGRIPATILSRVRKFRFDPFTDKQTSFVLNSLFVNPSEVGSVRGFFYIYSGVNQKLLEKSAENLVFSQPYDMSALVSELEKNQAWDMFFEFVTEFLRKRCLENSADFKKCSFLLDEIENAVSKGRAFNQVKRLTFDFVVFRAKEVLG